MSIYNQKFGIEIELTGLTREKAANVIAQYFQTTANNYGGAYCAYTARDGQNRTWKVVRDASITCQYRGQHASKDYSVELVSPICSYEDIPAIQEIVRKLRENGAVANSSCGIHIHINGAPFDANSLRNITNIMHSKETLLYKTLQVNVSRERSYCKKTNEGFLEALSRKKPKSIAEIQKLWYNGNDGSSDHYHSSRYHCLNLHSLFSKGTIEFRLFNSTTHAGKIKAYIQLCLAISNQALTQKCASKRITESSNEKYTFRTWLLRLGLIGDEFKTARKHLLDNLDGSIAWKDPQQAIAQKERLRNKIDEHKQAEQQEQSSAPTLSM